MITNNLTSEQDRLISRFSESVTPQEIIDLITDLDTRLTEAKDEIEKLRRENDELTRSQLP